MPLPKIGFSRFLNLFRWGGKTSAAFAKFTYASKFGIGKYGALTKLTQGMNVQVHYLIEKRFSKKMGQEISEMPSIVLTKAEHLIFTNKWRKAIPYGKGTAAATKEKVLEAAKDIYKDYPEILKALELK